MSQIAMSVSPLVTYRLFEGIIQLEDGTVAVICGAQPDIMTYGDGIPPEGRPSQAGDMLSVQPWGALQGRPSGTFGAFEIAQPVQGGLLYCPKPDEGKAFFFAFAPLVPNV